MTEDLVPTMPPEKLLNPALIRFIGATEDSRPVVTVDGERYPILIVSYDDHTDEVVIGLAAPEGDTEPPLCSKCGSQLPPCDCGEPAQCGEAWCVNCTPEGGWR